MTESVYLAAREAAYNLATIAHIFADCSKGHDRKELQRAIADLRRTISEFEQRFPGYENAIDRALPGIPFVSESLSVFRESGGQDSVHRAVLEHGRSLRFRIQSCYQQELRIVKRIEDIPPPSAAELDEDRLYDFYTDQQSLKLTRLPEVYHQLKRETQGAQRAIEDGVENPADGPVPPNRFRDGETLRDGFTPSQFSFLQDVWNSDGKTASFEELARYLYDDHTADLTERAAPGLANKINDLLGNESSYRVKVTKVGHGSARIERIEKSC